MEDVPEYPHVSSRYGDRREIEELSRFVGALRDRGLRNAVSAAFYDSKFNVCELKIAQGIAPEMRELVQEVAYEHIAQYRIGTTVYHGRPMDDLQAWYFQDESGGSEDMSEDFPVDADASTPQGLDRAMPAGGSPEADWLALEQRWKAGREGERALAEWFSRELLSFVAVCQQPETFSQLFAGEVKRPDFLLLFDALGLIAVDAKNLTPKQWNGSLSYTLPLDDEVKRAVAFERIFRMPVWYAIKNGDEWLWISALKAVEVGVPRQNRRTGANFVAIDRSHFVPVRTGADLAGLYGQRMTSYSKVALLVE